MFKRKKTKCNTSIVAPVDGRCISITEVRDEMFSKKIMGDGVAFLYEGDQLYSPCDGEILVVAQTKHAIGIRTIQGYEILLHVGMDTVELAGQGFTALVKEGQRVTLGQPILRIDRVFMEKHQMDLTTPMVITNATHMPFTLCNVNQEVKQGISEIIR